MTIGTATHLRRVVAEPSRNSRASEPDMPFAEGAHDELSADFRHRLISEAAYFLYSQRGYDDGYDMDDWLQAEAEIDHLLLNPSSSGG